MKKWQIRVWAITAAAGLLVMAAPLSSLAFAASTPDVTLASRAAPWQLGASEALPGNAFGFGNQLAEIKLAIERLPTSQPDIQSLTSPATPISQVLFVGRTSPNALVAVVLDNDLLEVAAADMVGDFVIDIELAEAVASPAFSLFAQDTLRLQTAHVQVRPEPEGDGRGMAGFLMMPPTFKVLTPVIYSAGSITVAGSGAPATKILLVIDGEPVPEAVETGLDGFWSVSLEGPWEPGEHSIHALNWDSRGLTSLPSVVEQFTAII